MLESTAAELTCVLVADSEKFLSSEFGGTELGLVVGEVPADAAELVGFVASVSVLPQRLVSLLTQFRPGASNTFLFQVRVS